MAEKQTGKTPARLAERQRRRAERERQESLKRLIPFWVLGLIAVFIVGLGAFGAIRSTGAFANPNGKSQFSVDAEKLELGDRKLGTSVRAEFKVKNTGDGILKMQVPSMPTAVEGC